MSTYCVKNKFLQVCIQKTASTSISKCLQGPAGGDIPNHLTAVQLISFLSPLVWSQYYTFAFVRNPWERLVSWHSMIINNPHIKGAFLITLEKPRLILRIC